MLKAGDTVRIQGTQEIGTVKEVHPHEVIVRVAAENGHSEATGFIDH
jgi:hypothetical protein